jgi:transcriptional regulator with XRE-family HTH domain
MKPVDVKAAVQPRTGEPTALSGFLKNLRGDRGWTLADAAAAAGVAKSTLSKIENGQMSPTYDMLLKLARGYGVDIADFFAPTGTREAAGRMAVTRRGTGRHHDTKLYDHEVLAAELSRKKIMPFCSHIKYLPESEELDWSRHDGEEFLYVLKGTVTFHTEHYEPVVLEAGDSIYIDSGMAHAVVAHDKDGADVLWVTAV